MNDIPLSRFEVGNGRSAKIRCEEVQAVLWDLSIVRQPLEDPDYEIVIVAHVLTCFKCSEFFRWAMAQNEPESSPTDGDST